MKSLRSCYRAVFLIGTGLAASAWWGCSEQPTEPTPGPSFHAESRGNDAQQIRAAIQTQLRHNDALLKIPGVVGTAVGRLSDGRTALRVLVEHAGVRAVPATLDGLPVETTVTGRIMALSDPTTRRRPAPVGFSVGHPAITAGTIGARVVDAVGNVYILSNNHVLAHSNAASIGDAEYQPGPFDGGTAADQIATLSAFQTITFSGTASNTIDAAIAIALADSVDASTAADDGYGAPNTTIYGDADDDGSFDDVTALLNLPVQKYGRTTGLTHGQITGVNATVTVCYEVVLIFCSKSARFVDQLIIDSPGFSDGGDSGSLIVTDDPNRNPVALLFAGSANQTIGNRIDLVLNRFGVKVDNGSLPPPTPLTDVAVTSVTAPSSTNPGSTINVVVTIRNAGNQNVSSAFDVSLQDVTAGTPIGSPQSIPGLAPGVSTTRTFAWNTTGAALGIHTLTASHTLSDDVAANNESSTTVNLATAPPGMHVGDLDATTGPNGNRWTATVKVTIHNGAHALLNGATVRGVWNPSGLASDECTTGELGELGTCIFLFPSIRQGVPSETFTIKSVTKAGQTYRSGQNHDPDGDSNGTSIKANRP